MILTQNLSQIPIFFIIGRARSGTTLLRTMLDAHPQVCIPIESPLILHLSEKYIDVKNWTPALFDEFFSDLCRVKDFDKWECNLTDLRNSFMKLPQNIDFQSIVKLIYLHYPSLFAKQNIVLIGDKNPVYSVHIRRISRIFPEAKYIHLTRDFRDHILSMIRTQLFTPVVLFLAFRWKYSVKQMLRYSVKYPEMVFTLRYEDLVATPEKYLAEICRFLNINYLPGMANFHAKTEKQYHDKIEAHIEEHHKKVFSPVATDRVYVWKSQMNDDDIRVADFVVGKYAEKAGYERKYKTVSPGLYLRLLPGILYAYFSYFMKYISDFTPFVLKRTLRKYLPLLSDKLTNVGK